jgi:glutamyl-tRNA synthetase
MTADRPVRVRYAPSPTGAPHIGGFRTALFDWLIARHTGGAFILRIEDTDRTRYVSNSVEGQMEALRWLGLDWDEGPDIGGPHAPYTQSERLPLYQDAARRLIARGNAYECYCTPARLDAMRTEQQRNKQPPGYDGLCRTPEGRAQAKAEAGEGASPVVRFQMPDEGETVFDDFLRGAVTFKNALLDDFVILKSDGFPTYHLAMPVDDHEMEITHVIRGEEWLPSAPRHQLLFQALGYQMPVIIHVSLILGTDRSKLSKRHGAQSVLEYKAMGYLPDAVLNFLALLGWSLDDKTEIISRDELVKNFSLERLIPSPAIFDIEKLNWMNGEYMRNMPEAGLARLLIDWLEKPESEGGLPDQVARPLDVDYTLRILPLVRERVKLLPEARDMMAFFYLPDGVDPDADMLLGKAFATNRDRARRLLSEALVVCDAIEDWQSPVLNEAFRDLAERLEVKTGDLFMLVRVAVTGRTVAPPLFDTMAVVGKERCVERLRVASSLL